MIKKVLIALTHGGLNSVAEFPYLLEQAGIEVTFIGENRLKCSIGRGYSHWITSSNNADEIITDIAKLFMANDHAYDWVILGQDSLLRALYNSPITINLKTRIGPIGNAHHISILGSKCNNAQFCGRNDIPVPPFSVCNTLEEIHAAARAIGFPVIVKVDHSVASDGTFKCTSPDDIALHSPLFRGTRFLVEKFIAGEQIRLDPLYLNGKLIACSAGIVTETVNDGFGVATRRKAHATAPYEAMLNKLGAGLELNGFMSMGLLRDTQTGEVYLFEIDCRPNPWPPYGKFIGADFTAALKDYYSNPSFSNIPYLSIDNGAMITILWRDLPYIMRKAKIGHLLGWLTNRHKCWRLIPWHDPRLLIYWMMQICCKGFGFISKKISAPTR